MTSNQKPYVEFSIVRTKEKSVGAKDLLEKKKQEFEMGKNLNFIWKGMDSIPILRVEFENLDAMRSVYEQEFPFYELALKHSVVLEQNLKPKLQSKRSSISKHGNHTGLNDIYIITHHKTNHKEVLRNFYQFTIPVSNLVGAEISIEEVEDGYIHFVKTKEVFRSASINRLNARVLKNWFKSIGVDCEKDELSDFFSELEDLVQNIQNLN